MGKNLSKALNAQELHFLKLHNEIKFRKDSEKVACKSRNSRLDQPIEKCAIKNVQLMFQTQKQISSRNKERRKN